VPTCLLAEGGEEKGVKKGLWQDAEALTGTTLGEGMAGKGEVLSE